LVKSSARKCELHDFPDSGWNMKVLGTVETLHTNTPATRNPSLGPEAWKLGMKLLYNLSCRCWEDINTSISNCLTILCL